jgi:serine/threonine protein phosphatase PrpC
MGFSSPKAQQRHRANRQALDVEHLFAPILRAIGDRVMTPREIEAALPHLNRKHVRRALLVLTDDGILDRVADSTSVLYVRSSTPEEA